MSVTYLCFTWSKIFLLFFLSFCMVPLRPDSLMELQWRNEKPLAPTSYVSSTWKHLCVLLEMAPNSLVKVKAKKTKSLTRKFLHQYPFHRNILSSNLFWRRRFPVCCGAAGVGGMCMALLRRVMSGFLSWWPAVMSAAIPMNVLEEQISWFNSEID